MGFLRRISLTQWILIAMVVGTLIGWLDPSLGVKLQLLSTIFQLIVAGHDIVLAPNFKASVSARRYER